MLAGSLRPTIVCLLLEQKSFVFLPLLPQVTCLPRLMLCLVAHLPLSSTLASNWERPWTGYSGFPEPDDVDKRDIGEKNENVMWEKYSLKGRISSTTSGAIGVSCFFVGKIWEMEATGQSLIIDRQQEKTLRAAVGHPEILVHRVYLKANDPAPPPQYDISSVYL